MTGDGHDKDVVRWFEAVRPIFLTFFGAGLMYHEVVVNEGTSEFAVLVFTFLMVAGGGADTVRIVQKWVRNGS